MLLEFLNSHGIQNNMRCFCGVVLILQEHFFFLSQMKGDVSNMSLYSYVASMWAWPPPKCHFLLKKCQHMWVFVSISIFVFLRSTLFGLLLALFFWFSSPLSAADIVAIGSFIISWNSNDILTNPRAFQIPTDWLFHCFFVGLSSLLQMCTDGYRINVLFFWSRSVIVWLLWRLFHIGGLIESISQRQPLLTTKGTRFPHVH